MGKKVTTITEFIEKSSLAHGDRYDYSNAIYISNKVKVEILCRQHGMFHQLPQNHYKGHGCSKCAVDLYIKKYKQTKEDFIEKANKVHNNLYDYSESNYIDINTKLKIKCSIHGEFIKIPNVHINNQEGCPYCKKENDRLYRQREFINKATKLHNNMFNYSQVEYINADTKVKIICKKHGEYLQTPGCHLTTKHGCPNCANEDQSEKRTDTVEQFIEKASKTHDNFYRYDKAIYKVSTEKVTITCPIHGDFLQPPKSHIEGKGCTKCGKESHWRRPEYIKKANGRICTFYTLRCFNEEEEFYKIGITMNTIKERYNNIKKMPYNYEIVSEIYGEAGFIWDLEKDEKRKLKVFNYQPKIIFGGSSSECFTRYN